MLHQEAAQWLRDGLSDLQVQVLKDPRMPYSAKATIALAISENVFRVIDELEGVIR